MANFDEKPAISIENVNDALEELDWDDLLPRLTLYARRKLATSAVLGIVPSVQAEDLVQEAVMSVISGTRAWDSSKVPALNFFIQVIRSEISNLAAANRGRSRTSLSSDTTLRVAESHEAMRTSSAEDVLMFIYEHREAQEFASAFHDSLRDEDLLQKIVEKILYEDLFKPEEIAKALGSQANKIYNAKKQLRRRLRDFIIKQKGGGNDGNQ